MQWQTHQKQGIKRSRDLVQQTENATEAQWHQVWKKNPLKALADNNMQQNKKTTLLKKRLMNESIYNVNTIFLSWQLKLQYDLIENEIAHPNIWSSHLNLKH